MGILTRRQGATFVITSDHTTGASAKRAPPRLSNAYHVWTGSRWSGNATEAMTFESLDEADEYVRAHYAQVRV